MTDDKDPGAWPITKEYWDKVTKAQADRDRIIDRLLKGLEKIAEHDFDGCAHAKLAECGPHLQEKARELIKRAYALEENGNCIELSFLAVRRCAECRAPMIEYEPCGRCQKEFTQNQYKALGAWRAAIEELRRRLGVLGLDDSMPEGMDEEIELINKGHWPGRRW
jgi:hypothetical protein